VLPPAPPDLARLAPTLVRGLEILTLGLALYAGSGRLVFANEALRRLFRRAPDRSRLQRALDRLAHSLLGGGHGEPSTPAAVPRGDARIAQAEVDGFRVRAVDVAGEALVDGGAVLVLVECAEDSRLLDPVGWDEGLTRRERAVAVLLADGCSNADIAEALDISSHTARHHTESVMRKLGVRSRSQVAARVRGTAGLLASV
jgi:DNA-binding CsgD family transcriptional regulator